jgi:hypothetical protein
MKHVTFKLIEKKQTPSGLWDNGAYAPSKNTVELPETALNAAVIVYYPNGRKGMGTPISRIDFDGNTYLVAGDARRK